MASLLTDLYCAKIISKILTEYLGTNARYILKYDNLFKLFLHLSVKTVPINYLGVLPSWM